MGGARASRLHLLGECLGSKQELPQSLWPGALLGAGLVVPHSQPAAFIKELIDNFASHLREASGRVYLAVSWSCSPTRGALSLSYALCFHPTAYKNACLEVNRSQIHVFDGLTGSITITFFIGYPGKAAASKSLRSCLTLCDPRDSSPPGSPVPGILQARTLEWVAISFSNA